MKILLTGGSSFTGLRFAQHLVAAGHRVTASLRGRRADYSGLRRERVDLLGGSCEVVEACEFGSDAFIGLCRDAEVLCHHAAVVEGYRSPDFDVAAAFAANTRRGQEVLRTFTGAQGKAVILTGSVFEADEGAGEEPRRAFSPYGLSKTITAQFFRYWCEALGVPLGKFVIPNPFGPYEDPRFCAYLLQTWSRGETPVVKTPLYVRDNVHVGLLADAYVEFVERTSTTSGLTRAAPSGYVESQGTFAARVGKEIGRRLNLRTPIEFADQTDFSEPLVRINTTHVMQTGRAHAEGKAWDELADYYSRHYGIAFS
jgi:nucleoside-diphosphate-sugar epimerase